MMRKLKRTLRDLSPIKWNHYPIKSYSQEGEDAILSRVFEHVYDGFYVDVGAFHPKRFSNTYLFYQRGWRGINIDATPGSMRRFKRIRPRDINVETAIAATQRSMTLFVFNEPALNSFDPDLAINREQGEYHIQAKIEVAAQPLKQILVKYLPPGRAISFLSIDVEGLDLEVMQSNDWDQFRPKYVLVECWSFDIKEITENKVYQFLSGQGYTFFAKTVSTVIFKDSAQVFRCIYATENADRLFYLQSTASHSKSV